MCSYHSPGDCCGEDFNTPNRSGCYGFTELDLSICSDRKVEMWLLSCFIHGVKPGPEWVGMLFKWTAGSVI